MDSYMPIDVFRGVVKYTTLQKLSAKEGYLMVSWIDMAKYLEPSMTEWEEIREFEEEFKKRIALPIRELQRCGLLYSGDTAKNNTFLILHQDLWRGGGMSKSELDSWAIVRISECLPWLVTQ